MHKREDNINVDPKYSVDFAMFVPTNTKQFDAKSMQSYGKPPTCFGCFRPSSQRYSTKKKEKHNID